MTKPVFNILVKLGKSFGESGVLDQKIMDSLARPERLKGFSLFLNKVLLKTPLATRFWDKQLKENQNQEVTEKAVSDYVEVYTQQESTLAEDPRLNPKFRKILEKAKQAKARNKEAVEAANEEQPTETKSITRPSGTPDADESVALESGKTDKSLRNEIACQVSGVQGDPFFGCMDKFYVAGVSVSQSHAGEYRTVEVVHEISTDGYVMTVIGTKKRSQLTSMIQAAEQVAAEKAAEANAERNIIFYRAKNPYDVDKADVKNQIAQAGKSGKGTEKPSKEPGFKPRN